MTAKNQQTGMKWIVRILGAAIAGYVMALTYMYVAQESFLFHPRVTAPDQHFRSAPPMEEIWMDVGGDRIHSVYFPRQNTQNLILYFHGNAGLISDVWGKVGVELSEKLNAVVWVMDFPGFGLSSGKIKSEQQLMEMARKFFDSIPERGSYPNIYLFGRSMGTGIASKLAGEVGVGKGPNKVAAVILEAPFSSLTTLVGERVPWVPSFLLRYKFESADSLKKFGGPVLVLHGDQDVVIPVHHGRKLAELNSNVHYVEIPGHGHDDLRFTEVYWQNLKELIHD